MNAMRMRRQFRRQALRQLPFFVWLVVVWLAVWGQLTWLSLITGILVALFVVRFFYLPPAETPSRFNVFRFLILAGVFIFDLVRASFLVAWQAIRPKPIGVSSTIQLDLRTGSDLIMTLIALAITLIPGSFVIDVDRPNTILYLHVLGAGSLADLEKMRHTVFALEERFIRAIGSADDLKRVERWHEHNAQNPEQRRTPLRPRRDA